MARPTAESIAQRAFDLGLLTRRSCRRSGGPSAAGPSALDDLVHLLVRRELMTNYQVERLVKGERPASSSATTRCSTSWARARSPGSTAPYTTQTGQVVAVKVLRNRFSDNPAQYGQFVREGELGRTLRHPNIVPIYEVYLRADHALLRDGVRRGAEPAGVRQDPQE